MSREGKTAVITGASGGIGAAVARMLHERGVKLGLASRRGSDLGFADAVAQSCDVPYEAVCCASKFGQVGLTRALDHELREQGIRCTNVCPGGVVTDFALKEGRGRTPDALPGMMTADDVAEVVVFVLERPRHFRILETAMRPLAETSWG
jgi:meso-butanediol dehydrogenase/(S,S)-butanediol dehydrogenase/diacetyl reductase